MLLQKKYKYDNVWLFKCWIRHKFTGQATNKGIWITKGSNNERERHAGNLWVFTDNSRAIFLNLPVEDCSGNFKDALEIIDWKILYETLYWNFLCIF